MLLCKVRFYRSLSWCWQSRHRYPLTVCELVDDALRQIEAWSETGCTCGTPPQEGLVTVDLELVDVNAAVCEYTGRPAERVRGRPLAEFIMPRNLPVVRGMVQAARRGGVATGFARDPAGAILELTARWLPEIDLYWLVARYCCPVHHAEPLPLVIGKAA